MEASYAEAVNKIEKFMQDGGIRKICSDLCVGRCCSKCYKSEKACRKNEGRRLACSFFMCYPLKALLFTKYEEEIFDTVDRIVGTKIRDAIPGYSVGYSSMYFDINDQSTRDKFSIDINVLNRLNKIDIKRVSDKSFALHELWHKFCTNKMVDKQ